MAAKSVGENCWMCSCAYCVPLVNLCARVYIRGKIRDKANKSVSDQFLESAILSSFSKIVDMDTKLLLALQFLRNSIL